MTGKVYEFKANNKEQVLQEADFFRKAVLSFNENSKDYQIDRIVLGSNKLSSLFGEEDSLFISFKSNLQPGYKDVGFLFQGADELTLEIHKAQAHQAITEVKDLLNEMMHSKILKIKPLIELESGRFFKKNVTKEIYRAGNYFNNVDLDKSWSRQRDTVESLYSDYQRENLKNRIPKIEKNSAKSSLKK